MNPAAGAAKTKDGAVELFRWLCILSVLLHHSIFPSRQSPRTLDAIFEAKELLSWCVTGFFFVSGWLSRPETFGLRSVAERARRLLVPFACINAAVCAVMLSLIRLGLFHPHADENWSLGYIALRMVYLQGLGPQFYFLPCLFLVGILSMSTARAFGRTGGALFWTAAALALCLFRGIPSTPYGGELDRFPFYCSILSLGMCLRDGHRDALGAAISVAGLLAGIVAVRAGWGTTILHVFLPIPLFLLLRRLVAGRPLAALSSWNSGTLYMWHAPFVHPASSVLWHKAGLPGGVETVLAMATTVVACQAIHLLISRLGLGKYLGL